MADEHPKGTWWIWSIFWLLLIVTAAEVALGIWQPDLMMKNFFLGMKLLNWTFIIMTLAKAYYIVTVFMHVKYESRPLKLALTLPMVILIPYLTFILLVEGGYLHSVLS